ncbi:hypothetical protein [Nocardia noduli]|uniref:hypothetical protein n=1 Tax=Nocardia noduli TaxID=2815722 RepID=UPI001C2187E4|nr:hypothetical protein [Nocardia noduli]
MLIRRVVLPIVITASAMASPSLTAGTAAAEPAAAVGYTARTTPESTVIVTDSGSMAVRDGVFTIVSDRGAVLAGTELSFRVDDFVFPIAAQIDGKTATLTPLLDRDHAEYRPVALPYEDKAPFKNEYDREQAAWGRMVSTITMGASLGSLVGGLSGAAVGCVLGGIAGATIASAAIVGLFGAFIPAAAVGCVGGMVAIGTLGTLVGQLLVTAPMAIMAAVQYFTTIAAPAPAK